MLQIKVDRFRYTDKLTMGKMYLNGIFHCYTLEDKVRPKNEKKVMYYTAIPAGTYTVNLQAYSMYDYLRGTPVINNVPGFTGIRIHGGHNSFNQDDTEGCILVGDADLGTKIGDFKVVLPEIIARIKKANNRATIIITDSFPSFSVAFKKTKNNLWV